MNEGGEEQFACLQGDRTPTAACLAVEIGFLWLLRGEQQIGSGWISRASRLLADAPECPEQGYLRYLDVLEALATARFDDAAPGPEGLDERMLSPCEPPGELWSNSVLWAAAWRTAPWDTTTRCSWSGRWWCAATVR